MIDDETKPPTDYMNPNWENTKWVHDWKNYISDQMQSIWDTFTDEQKVAISINAQHMAGREEWE